MRGVACLAALLFLAVFPAAAQQLELRVANIERAEFSARDLHLQLSGGEAAVDIAELRIADREWRGVGLRCAQISWRGGVFDCRRGKLKLPDLPLVDLAFRYAQDSGAIDVELQRMPLALLRPLLQESWTAEGRVDATLHLDKQGITAHLTASEVSFTDVAGTRAGEHLGATLDVAAQSAANDSWAWQAQLTWKTGGVYWQPLFLKAEAQSLTLSGQYDGTILHIHSGAALLGALGRFDFSLAWDLGAGRLVSASATGRQIDLAQAGPVLLHPFLEQAGLPKPELAGTAGLSVAFSDDLLQRVDLELDAASVLDRDAQGNGRFALNGIRAHVPWRRDEPTEAYFVADGGSFGKLPLGAISLPLRMNGFHFDLDHAEISVLDGKLNLDDFHAHRQGDDWHGRLAGALQPVSMTLLSESLGLPRMSGLISATIPRISYRDKVLSLDGDLIITLFDGYVSATGLRVVDPLGRAPRLEADLEMRHFDLGMLTETFSFGDITGYLDGDVKDLELVGWRPQRFAARLRSSPGDYRKRISQRAVQDISSLGGAGAAAAIERSFLGVFKTFGYDKIGLTANLSNGVCHMDGVEPAPYGYVIVKGGGIPALSVIGYNRQVQWDELINRLVGVIRSHGPPVIR